MSRPLLTVDGLTKAFPGLLALDDVSLDVSGGEIVAVVGQNGSGKSTLVKVLAGVYSADGGSVRVGDVADPAESAVGLHFIHQDLGLVAGLSTVENLDLTRVLGRKGLRPFRRRREVAYARELIARFGASFDVELPIGELSAEERTIVAIARALDGWSRPDEILVLDEPTAALHGTEVERLFSAVKRVAAQGAGVIFISHRLDEVLGLADRVVALRDGRLVADVAVAGLDHDKLVHVIAGREVRPHEANTRAAAARPVVLTARGLAGGSVRGVDLTLHAGEIVGLSGSLGSGREQLARLLFGAQPRAAGEVAVLGEALPASPRASIQQQLAYVSGDRHLDGAVMDMSVRENLTLPMLSPLTGRLGQVRTSDERKETADWAQRVELQPPDPERKLSLFSGGNQQKVVLAKWLRTDPKVLLLDEPTQGVDVGAKAAIYKLIAGAAERGTAVMVSSSDTRELVTICDRVLVLRDGSVAGELADDQLTEENLIRQSLDFVRATAVPQGSARG